MRRGEDFEFGISPLPARRSHTKDKSPRNLTPKCPPIVPNVLNLVRRSETAERSHRRKAEEKAMLGLRWLSASPNSKKQSERTLRGPWGGSFLTSPRGLLSYGEAPGHRVTRRAHTERRFPKKGLEAIERNPLASANLAPPRAVQYLYGRNRGVQTLCNRGEKSTCSSIEIQQHIKKHTVMGVHQAGLSCGSLVCLSRNHSAQRA